MQTLLALQVRTPQQSELLPQTLLLDWHGPVWLPPGMELTSTPPLQAAARIRGRSRAGRKSGEKRRSMIISLPRFPGGRKAQSRGANGAAPGGSEGDFRPGRRLVNME